LSAQVVKATIDGEFEDSFWKQLLSFDYTEVASVVQATAAGGTGVMDQAKRIENETKTQMGDQSIDRKGERENRCRGFAKTSEGRERFQELNRRKCEVKVTLISENKKDDSARFALVSP
jgi:hypothetical protein